MTVFFTTVYISGDPNTATTDSLWRIFSVTKTYVAAAILSLVKDYFPDKKTAIVATVNEDSMGPMLIVL